MEIVNTKISIPKNLEDWAGKIKAGFDNEKAVETLDQLISGAIHFRITDLHFQSEKESLELSFRKDGILKALATLPNKQAEILFTRIKVLAKLVTYQKRIPQDGSLSPEDFPGTSNVDIRVAIAPTIWGEHCVLRFLYGVGGVINLESLGWENEVLEKYKELLFKERGVILLTGPCGSGKTTTIASSLKFLANQKKLNIHSIEDPVEYKLKGVNQMSIDTHSGLDYAAGVRAWLRHDPDVLAVGEIREPETASVVMEAGLLGHLVFSTIHGGSPASVILRLLDMGIFPSTLTASISAIISQRLVGKLCSECWEEKKGASELTEGKSLPDGKKRYFQGKGCSYCDFTGFSGRQGMFEVVLMTDFLREVIFQKPEVKTLKEVISKTAISTLTEHGKKLVQSGVTTPQEILRVIGD